jgi:hypothetical protein
MAVQNTPVNAFCIASSDAGYRYLAYHVRARGKYTLGIGRRQASAEWRESCNNFRFLENPRCADGMETEAEAERETEAETDEEDAYGGAGTGETVSEGILGYGFNCCGKADRDGWILLSDFCNTIRDRRPLFSWKRYGEKPIDALERFAAAHPGVIELDKSRVDAYRIRRNPPYPSGRTALSCRPAIPCETVIGEGTGSIQKIADTYGFIENSEGIFYFKTEDAIPTESDPPKMAEGDTVSFKITKMPDAEKKIPEERNGKAVAVKTPPPQPPQPPAVSAWPPVVSK